MENKKKEPSNDGQEQHLPHEAWNIVQRKSKPGQEQHLPHDSESEYIIQTSDGQEVHLPHESWQIVQGKPALKDGWQVARKTGADGSHDMPYGEIERHLPHESWHVVQPKNPRRPRGPIPILDDED